MSGPLPLGGWRAPPRSCRCRSARRRGTARDPRDGSARSGSPPLSARAPAGAPAAPRTRRTGPRPARGSSPGGPRGACPAACRAPPPRWRRGRRSAAAPPPRSAAARPSPGRQTPFARGPSERNPRTALQHSCSVLWLAPGSVAPASAAGRQLNRDAGRASSDGSAGDSARCCVAVGSAPRGQAGRSDRSRCGPATGRPGWTRSTAGSSRTA